MPEIGNPYSDPRDKSPGELREEWASTLRQALELFLGIYMTNKETEAVSTIVGLVMREAGRKGVDLHASPTEVLKKVMEIVK